MAYKGRRLFDFSGRVRLDHQNIRGAAEHPMGSTTRHRGWIAPVCIGLVGLALSCIAFWMASRADERRVMTILEFRSEWRARDLEAKIRLSANAVENIAIA